MNGDFAGDLAGDFAGEPRTVLARLLFGVCVAPISRSSILCCFEGELLRVLVRLLFGVGAAASMKSSNKFFAGDLSGLLRLEAVFLPDSILNADCGTLLSSKSSNECLEGVAAALGATFSWLSCSTFSTNGLEASSKMSSSSSYWIALEWAFTSPGESVDMGSAMICGFEYASML